MVFKIILSFSLLCTVLYSDAQSLTRKQIQDVEIFVRAFMSQIAVYSKCKGEKYLSEQSRIIEMLDNKDVRNFVFNDLFSSQTAGAKLEDHYNWQEYLDNIRLYFNNEIDVEFDNITVLDCIVRDGGYNYVFVTMDKTLSYKSQKNTYTLLLSLNINNYAAKEITSPKLYEGDCKLGTDNTDISKEISILKSLANEYLLKKDYVNARNLYLSVLTRLPTDLTSKNKIEECERLISYNSLLENAEKLITDKKYEDAKHAFSEIRNKYPESAAMVQGKIKQCDEEIRNKSFKQNVEFGDYYFRIANYDEARNYYYKALIYKPGNQLILSNIEKSKKADKAFVLAEITRAIRLAEKSRKNFGEAFRIMLEYEQSNLLSTQNYYFLTMMMDEKNKDVKNEMNYNNKDCENYLNIFSNKLRKKVSIEANIEIKERATSLLEEIINKRHQK